MGGGGGAAGAPQRRPEGLHPRADGEGGQQEATEGGQQATVITYKCCDLGPGNFDSLYRSDRAKMIRLSVFFHVVKVVLLFSVRPPRRDDLVGHDFLPVGQASSAAGERREVGGIGLGERRGQAQHRSPLLLLCLQPSFLPRRGPAGEEGKED